MYKESEDEPMNFIKRRPYTRKYVKNKIFSVQISLELG